MADRNDPSSKPNLSASVVISNGRNSNTAFPRNGVIRDLAEQMNEQEKHKYIKGNLNPHILPLP